MRSFGCVLFDLSRHRYRRAGAPRELSTRGQILYGHTFYMKDYRCLNEPNAWLQTLKLIMIADFFGVYDYAFEMVMCLASSREPKDEEMLDDLLRYYEGVAIQRTRIYPIIKIAERLGLRPLLESVVRMSAKLSSAYQIETSTGRSSWAD